MNIILFVKYNSMKYPYNWTVDRMWGWGGNMFLVSNFNSSRISDATVIQIIIEIGN
jgi:hypothetical protein